MTNFISRIRQPAVHMATSGDARPLNPYLGTPQTKLEHELRSLAKGSNIPRLRLAAQELKRRYQQQAEQGVAPRDVAPLDQRSRRGHTALEDAVRKCRPDATQVLLEEGADPTLRDPASGKNAFDYKKRGYLSPAQDAVSLALQGWMNDNNMNTGALARLNALGAPPPPPNPAHQGHDLNESLPPYSQEDANLHEVGR